MSVLEPFAYTDRDTPLTGLLARPTGKPRAAIVVYPTIANVTPAIERRALMLADAGFLAMIADFYGEPVESFEASLPLADKLKADPAQYRARILAAVAALEGCESAAGLKIGAIGYCMGGQAALEAARSGHDLMLAASFHGTLTTGLPADRPIPARILVCHGDADPLAPREQVLGFWQEMNAVGADWHFHAYAGVKHGFTDPGSDARGMPAIAYNSSADRQSWAALLGLLDEILG